ncbi:recombinase family protein [Mesobacillus maritimus]|uniref:recombinase family protein n=1 Tax=Mesobacillus maritimus TaxID=1643336 RepID=UPI0020418042|nr:recombinase family protein [Mesobacillus maritimus]
MNTVKYHVFFRRVSTAGQDIAMQSSADAPFREKLLPEEIMIIDEYAISANKLSVHERPEMQKVISLIKQERVHTLYAFDRTRLFRDSYEAQEFHDLRRKYNVNLMFTSVGNGHIQATEDIFLEGILNIFSDIEGKNIARRTKEALRRYPPKKIGYEKIKETKHYCKDPQKKKMLEQYFSSLLEISTIEELTELLSGFQKKLKLSLIDIARDPFYAAYDLSKGENRLHHVEPYIDLTTFNRIQEKFGTIFDSYLERIGKLDAQNAYTPQCGYCRRPLHYRIDEIKNIGYYSCSRKHGKVFITFTDLAKVIQLVLEEIIHHFDSKKLLNQSLLRFREIRKKMEDEIDSIETQLNEIMENIILNMDDYSNDWKKEPNYKRMAQLKHEKAFLLEELSDKEHLLLENKMVVEAVEDYLHSKSEVNPSLLFTMFVHKLIVYQNEVDIEVSMFDYLKDLKTDFIYKGEEIA